MIIKTIYKNEPISLRHAELVSASPKSIVRREHNAALEQIQDDVATLVLEAKRIK